MFSKADEQAYDFAINNPGHALKSLAVDEQMDCAQLSKIFMRAYLEINGGSRDNPITQSAVSSAVSYWKHHQKLKPWLARACICMNKKVIS